MHAGGTVEIQRERRGAGRRLAVGVKPVQLFVVYSKLAGCSDLSAQLFTSLHLQGGFFLPALATSAPTLGRTEPLFFSLRTKEFHK